MVYSQASRHGELLISPFHQGGPPTSAGADTIETLPVLREHPHSKQVEPAPPSLLTPLKNPPPPGEEQRDSGITQVEAPNQRGWDQVAMLQRARVQRQSSCCAPGRGHKRNGKVPGAEEDPSPPREAKVSKISPTLWSPSHEPPARLRKEKRSQKTYQKHSLQSPWALAHTCICTHGLCKHMCAMDTAQRVQCRR